MAAQPNGAVPEETQPTPNAANQSAAWAAANVSLPAVPSEAGDAAQIAGDQAVDLIGLEAPPQSEATVTSHTVSSSSAAPAQTMAQPPAQPALTAAELEENITKRLMEVMSAKLEIFDDSTNRTFANSNTTNFTTATTTTATAATRN